MFEIQGNNLGPIWEMGLGSQWLLCRPHTGSLLYSRWNKIFEQDLLNATHVIHEMERDRTRQDEMKKCISSRSIQDETRSCISSCSIRNETRSSQLFNEMKLDRTRQDEMKCISSRSIWDETRSTHALSFHAKDTYHWKRVCTQLPV